MGKRFASTVALDSQPLMSLTERQKQYALFVAEGKPAQTAARLAGYSLHKRDVERRLSQNPRISAAVQHLHGRYENAIVASRKQVLEGFLAAIEQAKLLSDPAVQVAGWREIGKMCGYYAPEVKEINVNVGAKRVIGQLEVLSDQELLQLIEKDREAIEGEAMEVLNDGEGAVPEGEESFSGLCERVSGESTE